MSRLCTALWGAADLPSCFKYPSQQLAPRWRLAIGDRLHFVLHDSGRPEPDDVLHLEFGARTHVKIRPHCPEENGIMERSNRTVREALEGEELTSRYQAEEAIGRIIRWYNEERLHSSLGYLWSSATKAPVATAITITEL